VGQGDQVRRHQGRLIGGGRSGGRLSMADHEQTITGTWNRSPDAVKLVDAHHHLWDLSLNYYPGLTDKPNQNFFLGSIDALRRNYLAEDYLRDVHDHNVLTTVHVEAEMSRDSQIKETQWLSQVNETHGFPGAIVAHAWFHKTMRRKLSRDRRSIRWCAAFVLSP
jgi:predicted TIM-barrel fold metal-dependent hydrolase